MSIEGGPSVNPEGGTDTQFVLPPPDDLEPPSDGFRTVVISVVVLLALIGGGIWFLGRGNDDQALQNEEVGPTRAAATATTGSVVAAPTPPSVEPPVQAFNVTGTAVINNPAGDIAVSPLTGDLSFAGSLGVRASNEVTGNAKGQASVTTGCYALGSTEQVSEITVDIQFDLVITGTADAGSLDLDFTSVSATPNRVVFDAEHVTNDGCETAARAGVANFVQLALGPTTIPAQTGATSTIGSNIPTTIELS
jgi:hypothetical protein